MLAVEAASCGIGVVPTPATANDANAAARSCVVSGLLSPPDEAAATAGTAASAARRRSRTRGVFALSPGSARSDCVAASAATVWSSTTVSPASGKSAVFASRIVRRHAGARTKQQLHPVSLTERDECEAAARALKQRQRGARGHAAGIAQRFGASSRVKLLLLCEVQLRHQAQASCAWSSRGVAPCVSVHCIGHRVQTPAEPQRDAAEVSRRPGVAVLQPDVAPAARLFACCGDAQRKAGRACAPSRLRQPRIVISSRELLAQAHRRGAAHQHARQAQQRQLPPPPARVLACCAPLRARQESAAPVRRPLRGGAACGVSPEASATSLRGTRGVT